MFKRAAQLVVTALIATIGVFAVASPASASVGGCTSSTVISACVNYGDDGNRVRADFYQNRRPDADQVYYRVAIIKGMYVTFDFQGINHPAYNRDRGQVAAESLLVHLGRAAGPDMGRQRVARPGPRGGRHLRRPALLGARRPGHLPVRRCEGQAEAGPETAVGGSEGTADPVHAEHRGHTRGWPAQAG